MAEIDFSWAANETKLKRAIQLAGPEASESAVRAEYEKLGGLIITKNIKMKPEENKVVDAEVTAPIAAVPEAPADAPAAGVAPAVEVAASASEQTLENLPVVE